MRRGTETREGKGSRSMLTWCFSSTKSSEEMLQIVWSRVNGTDDQPSLSRTKQFHHSSSPMKLHFLFIQVKYLVPLTILGDTTNAQLVPKVQIKLLLPKRMVRMWLCHYTPSRIIPSHALNKASQCYDHTNFGCGCRPEGYTIHRRSST